MSRNIEYTIITDYGPEYLCTRVNQHLKDGWELLGSHLVADTGEDIVYSQAMIRDRKPYLQHNPNADYRESPDAAEERTRSTIPNVSPYDAGARRPR